MSESSKPNPTNGSQSKPADECSTSSRVGHRCPAPSPSPGLVSHLSSAGTSAVPMAPPPPGIPSGPSQPAQSPAPPARPGPLFTTRTPKPRHTTFKTVKIHTAKCDVCNHHNTATLSRCIDCGWQICSPCLADRGGNKTHTGAAPVNFKSRVNAAPTRVNPSPNVPIPAPTTTVNPASSNIQGPTSNATGYGGSVSSPVPIIPAAPTIINPSHAPARTAPNVLPVRTLVGCAPINHGPTNNAPTNPATPTQGVPLMLSPTAAPVQEIPATRSVTNAEKNNEVKTPKNKGKGKEKAHSSGNNFEGEISEGSARTEDPEVWKKWVLRPRGMVNYYPELVSVEYTDNDKEDAVDDDTDDDSDDDTDDSDGGDIPFEGWKRAPSGPTRVDGPVQVNRPRSMAQTPTEPANQPLQPRPLNEINTDSEVNRSIENFLFAAAALVDLRAGIVHSGNRAESSNAATSSMPSAAMHPSVAPALPATALSASESNRKRKRKAPSAQLRSAKTQGRAIRTGHTKLEVYTDPGSQASTSRAEPEASEVSTSSSETDPEAKMDIDEDQPLDQEEVPKETLTATGSRNTTKAAPRLQNLYRDALRVKDRNGKLKRVDRCGPKA